MHICMSDAGVRPQNLSLKTIYPTFNSLLRRLTIFERIKIKINYNVFSNRRRNSGFGLKRPRLRRHWSNDYVDDICRLDLKTKHSIISSVD